MCMYASLRVSIFNQLKIEHMGNATSLLIERLLPIFPQLLPSHCWLLQEFDYLSGSVYNLFMYNSPEFHFFPVALKHLNCIYSTKLYHWLLSILASSVEKFLQ